MEKFSMSHAYKRNIPHRKIIKRNPIIHHRARCGYFLSLIHVKDETQSNSTWKYQ